MNDKRHATIIKELIMSVAILGNTGINAIAQAASALIFKNRIDTVLMKKMPVTTFDVNTIGQYLYQRNMDAYNQRYSEANPAPKFEPHYNDVPAVLTLAAIDAYFYQVSDLYDDKLTHLLNQTRLHVVRHMDGYDEAWLESMSD